MTALTAAALLSLAASCATGPLRPVDGRLVHRELGYSVDPPRFDPGQWRQVQVEGSDLAYRRSDGASLALMSDCTRGSARPVLLARQLLIGTSERELIESHPIALRGHAGWKLAFRTLEDGREVTVRAVVVTADECTFDWLWVAPGREEGAPWFVDWWASFERGEAEQ